MQAKHLLASTEYAEENTSIWRSISMKFGQRAEIDEKLLLLLKLLTQI